MLFKGMNQCAAEQSDDTKQKLQYINAFVKNPRENKAAVESFLKDIYGVLSLLMNSNLKCDRVKLFVDKQGDDAFGTLTLRSNPIYGLNRRGKAKLHMCSISDTLTVAQEAWVVLTLARCYYHHFNTFKQAAAARQAVREIQQLYEMKDEVLPEFQYILDQPIETVLRLKANLMRCWINTYKSILTKRSYNTALTAD